MHSEKILREIHDCSTDVDELFFDTVQLDSDGLWLWKGKIHYTDPDDEAYFENISIEKVPFATLDNAFQEPTKEG